MRLPRLADGERDLRLPVDLLQAERDRDVVVGAAQRARRLEKQIGIGGRFLAGEFRPAGRRHAGAQHFVDVFLKILRGVEHLAGPRHRRQRAQARELLRARPAFLFQEGHDVLQRGEIRVPVFQQAIDAVVTLAPARSCAQWRLRRASANDVVAEHDGGERAAARLCEGAELEGSAVHDCSYPFTAFWRRHRDRSCCRSCIRPATR